MFSTVPSGATVAGLRRKLTIAAVSAGLAGSVLVGGAAAPAQAEDANITCKPAQDVFAVADDGSLIRYQFNDLSTIASPVQAAAPATIGGGWTNFQKVLAGPDGWLYATSTAGTWAYHWDGTKWDVSAKSLGTGFRSYADPSRQNKLTIDSRGDFWAILDDGTLRRYEYNATTNALTSRPIASGWGGYNLITAAGDGVIYARTTAGALHRYQFEKTSDRLIQRTEFGGGWNNFGKVFSVGGDIILAIDATGRLAQYRYRPVPDGTWVLMNNTIGGGWGFVAVVGTSNACRLTASFVPSAPQVPTEQNSAIAVLQTAGGQIEYSYTDNIGQAQWGHQPDPTDFGGTAWTPVNGADAFTGTPGLVVGADNKVDITLHNINSTFAGRVQTAPASTQVGAALDRGGFMASSAVSVLNPSTSKIVMFSVDGAGALWGKPEGAGGLLAWQKFTSPVLSGVPAVGPGPSNTTTVIARDTAGTYWAANWNGTELSAFSSLGGSGFVGKVSIVRYPGDLLRVFAKDATGHLVTQKQTAPGTAFPGTWETIAADQTWPGSPAAIMSPATGLIEILVRGADGKNYFAQEIAQGSGSWGAFKDTMPSVSEQYTPDPAPFVYTADGVANWAFVTHTQDFQVRVVTASSASAAKTAKVAKVADPVFSVHKLPKAPK
ncbi:tachylectin-related carbohydrate-binding protein [Kribbella sp. GL6]|uniref:tachylectin-related carbohydrate-binding protein n=1 Tax=Kribbella sp. GL6 TaxID=3419765 RepID=UPI003D09129D